VYTTRYDGLYLQRASDRGRRTPTARQTASIDHRRHRPPALISFCSYAPAGLATTAGGPRASPHRVRGSAVRAVAVSRAEQSDCLTVSECAASLELSIAVCACRTVLRRSLNRRVLYVTYGTCCTSFRREPLLVYEELAATGVGFLTWWVYLPDVQVGVTSCLFCSVQVWDVRTDRRPPVMVTA